MTAIEERITLCRICEACCGMVATVEGGRITKLRADKENPFSGGYICPTGPAYLEVQNDTDRVLPLKRQPDGSFAPVSWDEALDDIAARLRVLLDTHGAESVGFYAGNQIAFNYAAFFWVSGFMAAIKSPHFYAASSIDINNRWAASAVLYAQRVFHKDRLVHFDHPEIRRAMERFSADGSEDTEFPLRLISLRELRSHNTWFHNVDKLMRERRRALRIHREDAAEVGVEEGDPVAVVSRTAGSRCRCASPTK